MAATAAPKKRPNGRNCHDPAAASHGVVHRRCALCARPAASAAQAQADYPNRQIRLLVGFAAGGPVDVTARITADALSAELGKTAGGRQPRRRRRQPRRRCGRQGAAGRLHAAAILQRARHLARHLQQAAVRRAEGFHADHRGDDLVPGAGRASVGAGEDAAGVHRATPRRSPARSTTHRPAPAPSRTSRAALFGARDRARRCSTCRIAAARRRSPISSPGACR